MKHLCILLLAALPYTAHPQNLVSNPGFDSFITCPGFGQFNNSYITDWSKPSIASSDYYNYNCTGIIPSLEFPYSGEAYAGIIAYNFGQEYREYVTGLLTAPLTAGQLYEVEFYVSLHNNYIQAIEEMGAYLSASAPGPFSNVLHIAVTPQIVNTGGVLSDTSGWEKVSGTFVASGGEQYITIGNFNSDSATTITQPYFVGSYGAYYFIDGVSVQEVNTSGISESDEINIPHLTINQQTLFIHPGTESIRTIMVTDLAGRLLMTSGGPGIVQFNLGDMASGICMVNIITSSGRSYTRKVVFTGN
jgi:hypothetical protein